MKAIQMLPKLFVIGLLILQPTISCARERLNFALAGAIRRGNPAELIECLDKNVDVNQIWQNKTSPLLYAIIKLKQEYAYESPMLEDAVYGVVAGLGAIGIFSFLGLPLIKEIIDNRSTLAGIAVDKRKIIDAIVNKWAFVLWNSGKLMASTGFPIILAGTSWNSFKKAGNEAWRRLIKTSSRVIIVERLIDYPATHLELEVNGVTALSMVRALIATEKSYNFKDTLRRLEKRILARLNDERMTINTPAAPSSDQLPASQETVNKCQAYAELCEKTF